MARTRAPLSLDETLLRIVEERCIGNQHELRAALRKCGHEISQPTLSRHLKRLHIGKRRNRYVVEPSAAFSAPPFSVHPAPPNLLVLKTLPGGAQLLAVLLDRARLPEIAGTMAGDDAVFVAVAEGYGLSESQGAIVKALAPDSSF